MRGVVFGWLDLRGGFQIGPLGPLRGNNLGYKSNTVGVLTTTRTWEFGERLQSIANVVNNVEVTGHRYLYDSMQRRTHATLEDSSIWRYDYNDRNEVIAGKRFWNDWTSVAGQQFEYAFDSIGNRTSTKAGGNENGTSLRSASYSANALNQYTSRDVPGAVDVVGAAKATASVTVNSSAAYERQEYFRGEPSVSNGSGPAYASCTVTVTEGANSTNEVGSILVPPATQAFQYDADGSLTNDSMWSYKWDGENRLIQMEGLSIVPDSAKRKLVFSYDYAGRRVSKKVYTWNSSLSTWNATPILSLRFVYDGWNLLAELNDLSSVVRAYAWGKDLSGTIDKAGGIGGLVVAVTSGGSYHFSAYDGNGNITGFIKAGDKSTSARYEFGPFGEVIRQTGVDKNIPFRWSTKYCDEESGIVYYGYRFYHPSIGRWVSRDPLEDLVALNPYAFVQNAPFQAIDPDGRLAWFLITMAAGGAIGAMTNPDDPWTGFLKGAAAGAVGYGAGALVAGLLGGGVVATTFGSSAAALASTYSGFVMDNYGAARDNMWALDSKQALVLTAAGAGTFMMGALFGSMAARATGDVDDALLDAMLSIAGGIGVGAANAFGTGAEAALDAGSGIIPPEE